MFAGTVEGNVSNLDQDIVCGVGGQLQNTATRRRLVGKTVKFTYGGTHMRRPGLAIGRGEEPNTSVPHWIIVFALTPDFPAGPATLIIQGLVYPGGKSPTQADETVDIPDVVAISSRTTISVADPPTPNRSQEEAEFFVASGPVSQGHKAVTATMNGIDAEYLTTEGGIWVAVFPPLPTEDDDDVAIPFILFAADNAAHSDSANYRFG